MKNFDEQLLRLKQAVKLTDDQDVAALLGMTKAAFSGRKKRGVFPEDKLFALATRRPEMQLDAIYILTGTHAATHSVLSKVRAASEIATRLGGTKQEQAQRAEAAFQQLHQLLPADEQMWLDSYREWSPALKKKELTRALGLVSAAAGQAPPAPASPPAGKHQTVNASMRGVVAGGHVSISGNSIKNNK